MKKVLKLRITSVILIIFTIFVILKVSPVRVFAKDLPKAEVVMERDSLRILKSRNEDLKLPNASTTKIITAITVLENSSLNDEVLITKESVGIEGSSIYLKEGEVLTVEELLYVLMLRSGNDSAVALALYVGKTIENFAKLMNSVAKKCGAENSNFVNPHGLDEDNHYTTAKDLALITCYALKNEVFKKIVSTKKITFGDRTFINKNKMLFNYDGADGVKTGYTKKSGRCLVSSATKGEMQLIGVILNYGPTYERTTSLFDDCFQKYSLVEVAKKGEVLAKIPIENGVVINDEYTVILQNGITLPLTSEEKNNLKLSFLPIKNLTEPINEGIYLGNLSITADKDLIFSSKLYTINTNDNHGLLKTLVGVIARWRFYES